MPKYILIILFFFLPISTFPQMDSVLHAIENYEKIELANGMKVLVVQTGSSYQKYIECVLFADFLPYKEKEIAGSMQIMSELLGGELENKSRLRIRRVAELKSIDSLFAFFENKITIANYDSLRIKNMKNFHSSKLFNENHEDSTINFLSKKIRYGKNHPFSEEVDLSTINNIDKKMILYTHKKIFNPENCYLVVVGNIKTEYVEILVNKHFGAWEKNMLTPSSKYNPRKPETQTAKFVNDNISDSYISITYPIELDISNENIVATQILNQLLSIKITENLVKTNKYVEHIVVKIRPNDYVGSFSINAKLKNNQVFSAVYEIIEILENIKTDPIDAELLKQIKTNKIQYFKESFRQQEMVAIYAYNIDYYNLDKNYYSNYLANLKNIDDEEIHGAAQEFVTLENSYCVIYGKEKKLSCEIYDIASLMKTEYIPSINAKPFKILNKGFGSQKIIDDYLDFCYAQNKINDITINFSAIYSFDTLNYNLEGVIKKKYPSYHYYKAELILEDEVLFHQLEICDGKYWLDSVVLSKRILSGDDLSKKIYKAYLFPEQFFKELKYSTDFICNIDGVADSLYVIEVITPNEDIMYHEFYDKQSKAKVKTEKLEWDGKKYNCTETYLYSNYKKIDDQSKVKIPFTINLIYKSVNVEMKITKIDTKIKIPKKTFKILK